LYQANTVAAAALAVAQMPLADFQRLAAQVVADKRDQVEGVSGTRRSALRSACLFDE
jgi:hypothetical protein